MILLIIIDIFFIFLFTQGMLSLKKMLPLFDTGSGSVYDLRHVTLGIYYTAFACCMRPQIELEYY